MISTAIELLLDARLSPSLTGGSNQLSSQPRSLPHTHTLEGAPKTSLASTNPRNISFCLSLLHVSKTYAFTTVPTWHQPPKTHSRVSAEGPLHSERLLHVLTSPWTQRLARGHLTWFLLVGDMSIFLAPIQPSPQSHPISPPM